jgi:hypothetical protein
MSGRSILSIILVLVSLVGCSGDPISGTSTAIPEGVASAVNRPGVPTLPPLDLSNGPCIAATISGGIYVFTYANNVLVPMWSKTSTTSQYWGVGIGNVAGDGSLELVVISRTNPKSRNATSTLDLEVYSNGSTGDFTPFSLLPQYNATATDLAMKDERVLVGGRSSLQLWTNTGGMFTKAWQSSPGNDLLPNVEIADANNDGTPDLIYASVSRNVFGVYMGDTWSSYLESSVMPSGVVCVTVGDLDTDGSNEVVSGLNDKTVTISKFSDASFSIMYTSLELGGYPDALAVGDFDHDGRNELAVAIQTGTTSGNTLTMYEWSGPGANWVKDDLQPTATDIAKLYAGNCDKDVGLELVAGCFGRVPGVRVIDFVEGVGYQSAFSRTPAAVGDLFVK